MIGLVQRQFRMMECLHFTMFINNSNNRAFLSPILLTIPFILLTKSTERKCDSNLYANRIHNRIPIYVGIKELWHIYRICDVALSKQIRKLPFIQSISNDVAKYLPIYHVLFTHLNSKIQWKIKIEIKKRKYEDHLSRGFGYSTPFQFKNG